MPTTLILGQQEAKFTLSAKGADGSAKPATWSARISDYAVAYVALQGGEEIHVDPKTLGNCTLTITSHSADGTPLPVRTFDFSIVPPPVPQAVELDNSDIVVQSNPFPPADPGSDTIIGTV